MISQRASEIRAPSNVESLIWPVAPCAVLSISFELPPPFADPAWVSTNLTGQATTQRTTFLQNKV